MLNSRDWVILLEKVTPVCDEFKSRKYSSLSVVFDVSHDANIKSIIVTNRISFAIIELQQINRTCLNDLLQLQKKFKYY